MQSIVSHLHKFREYGRDGGRTLIGWCLIRTFPLMSNFLLHTRYQKFQLWNKFHRPSGVRKALQETLDSLGLEYLDLYLIHWPVATLVCFLSKLLSLLTIFVEKLVNKFKLEGYFHSFQRLQIKFNASKYGSEVFCDDAMFH